MAWYQTLISVSARVEMKAEVRDLGFDRATERAQTGVSGDCRQRLFCSIRFQKLHSAILDLDLGRWLHTLPVWRKN